MKEKEKMQKELELLQEVAMTGWSKVSEQYDNMPQEFMIKYKDFIDWEVASITQTLTEETIEVLQDYFDWTNIGGFQRVSLDFVWKHRHQITNWFSVFECLDVDKEFMLRLVDDLGIDVLKDVCLEDIKDWQR